MNRNKRFLCAIGCLFGGLMFLAFGTVSMGITYGPPYSCVSMSPACGTYTTCAQFIGSCTYNSTLYDYNSLKNQNQKGGYCASNNGTGCTQSLFQCYTTYFTDTKCATFACSVKASQPNICTH